MGEKRGEENMKKSAAILPPYPVRVMVEQEMLLVRPHDDQTQRLYPFVSWNN